jgi:phosphoenolpyruvate synthase/pyruvate phosphate dikinase
VSFLDITEGIMVGGKARALAELLAAGFEVPPGFVVLGTAQPKDILNAYDALHVPNVAVRSSALNEDGAKDAWAGQLNTYLNIDRDSLLQRVQDCMQSANSDRAQAYAAHKNIAAGEVAVLVQAMVASDISGVAFSVHPVTKSPEHMVIEAGLGLGEAIVSGEITPDTYVVEANTGVVVESVVSTQSKQLVRAQDGTTTWQAIEPEANQPKLSPEQLSEIAEVLRKIAGHYGFPVDVEWAYEKNKLYILQSRPITTL